MADSETIVLQPTPDGTAGASFGLNTSSKISFYGVTPVVQRAGAAQAAVGTTAATTTTPWGFGSSTQADAVITLVNEMRAALVALGVIKGAA